MIYSVKRLLEIHKDAYSFFISIKCFSNLFSDTNKSMVSRMFISKAKLLIVQTIIEFKELVNPTKNKFFINFINIW